MNGSGYLPDTIMNSLSAGTFSVTAKDSNECLSPEASVVTLTDPSGIVTTILSAAIFSFLGVTNSRGRGSTSYKPCVHWL